MNKTLNLKISLALIFVNLFVISIAAKELYLPARIWNVPENNDFNSDTSEFNFKRMKQTENLAIFWSSKFGADPMVNPIEKERFNPEEILKEGERIYKYYVDSLKFVEKGRSITDKYKCLIFIINSNEGTAYGGGDEDKVGIFWAPPVRMNKAPFGALAHELGHSFQYLLDVDKSVYNPESARGVGSHAFVEMTSQYMLWNVYPEWISFENYHMVDFLKQSHLSFLHDKNMYHSPFVMEYWSSLHGVDIISKIWRYIKKGEDPVMAYKRLTNTDQSKFNDEIFDAARRFMTWDIDRIEAVSQKYANMHKTKMDTLADGWLAVSPSNCPQNYGYNGLQIPLPAKKKSIALKFEGLTGGEGVAGGEGVTGGEGVAGGEGVTGGHGYNVVNEQLAGWRYGFVAVKADGSRVYSPTYNQPKSTIKFKIPADTKYLWFVVTGAPTEHFSRKRGEKEEGWGWKIRY